MSIGAVLSFGKLEIYVLQCAKFKLWTALNVYKIWGQGALMPLIHQGLNLLSQLQLF
jgi:hypothetical protein